MKAFLILIFSLSFLCISFAIVADWLGIAIQWIDRAYGMGTILLFFVWMPFFLFSRRDRTKFLKSFDKNNE